MSGDRRMDKEIVVCIYSGILFSHSALCNSMDEPGERKSKTTKGPMALRKVERVIGGEFKEEIVQMFLE